MIFLKQICMERSTECGKLRKYCASVIKECTPIGTYVCGSSDHQGQYNITILCEQQSLFIHDDESAHNIIYRII